MTDPPSEYLEIPSDKYKHDWWHGKRGNFYWLQSKQFPSWRCFSAMPACIAPFRILVAPERSENLGKKVYMNDLGWANLGDDIFVSPLLTDLSKVAGSDIGDTFVMVPADADIEQSKAFLMQSSIFEQSLCYLGQSEDEAIKQFWTELEALSPLAHITSDFIFTVISSTQERIDQLVSSAPFASLSDELRRVEIKRIRDTWNAIGPECGPEKCVEPGCERLRIKFGIRCFGHQLQFGSVP